MVTQCLDPKIDDQNMSFILTVPIQVNLYWENFKTGRKINFFPVATWLLKVGGHYDTHTNNFYPVTVPDRLNCSYHVVKIFARATKRTLQWVIYNVKGN